MTQNTNLDPRTAGPKPPFKGPKQPFPGSEAKMDPAPDFGLDSYVGHGRLKGRVAIITGGDSGIGRAVALAYAREGADVAIAYLNEHEDAERTRQIVEAEGRRCLLMPGDLAEAKTAEAIIRDTMAEFGRIDVLVNNAASQREAEDGIVDLDDARVRNTFAVNIVSMFALVRLALPHLKPGASVINVASIQAYKPNPAILDYAATKGAIVAFTKGLAQEFGPRGLRANAIAPGPVWTPLITESFPKEKIESFGEGNPMGRPAQPADLAPPFVFLACDESRFVNGEILGVTGGGLLA
jgi:NAD(P)-dependent dehydrogenase (short-subunit alcohol dehydrogenase family)